MRKLTAIAVLSVLVGCGLSDPVESSFYLAGDDMPSWYTNNVNGNVKIKFDIHTSGRVDVFLRRSDAWDQKLTGTYEEASAPPVSHPTETDAYPNAGYPQRLLITVQGKSDLYEQRALEPYIYVVKRNVH